MSQQASVPDPELIKQQAGKLLNNAAGFVAFNTVEIGLRHGLIREIASNPEGLTSGALAESAGLNPFYVDVWCLSAYAAELLEVDGSQRYSLGPHLATLLLDQDSPAYMGGSFLVLGQPEIFDQFSANLPSGNELWWSDCSPDFIDAVSKTGRAFYNRLIPGGLQQVPGLADQLDGAGAILELACGVGTGLVRLARTYPETTLVGVDGDAFSIARAQENVGEAGLADRVELIESPLEEFDRSDEFDACVINISMHECRDIERVTDNVHRALRPAGHFVISDFPFPETPDGLRSPPGRFMSGIQFFEALIGDQLLPTRAFTELLEGHGFRDVGSFDLTPVHAVTFGRKSP